MKGSPVVFWDVFGEQGHPLRTTISEMGPLLLSRILNLNETQSGVLNMTFKLADDHGLLLLDLKDLQAMIQFAGDQAEQFTTQYGNISKASVGAIQRGLLTLEQEGGDRFFGEPALNIQDFHPDGWFRQRGHQCPDRRPADAVPQGLCHAPALAVVRTF